MSPKSLASFELSTAGLSESFSGTSTGSYLGHYLLPPENKKDQRSLKVTLKVIQISYLSQKNAFIQITVGT
jgi:hypothetical protein